MRLPRCGCGAPSFARMLLTWLPAVLVLMNRPRGDLGVGQSFGDQSQHLLLAPRERADVARAGAALTPSPRRNAERGRPRPSLPSGRRPGARFGPPPRRGRDPDRAVTRARATARSFRPASEAPALAKPTHADLSSSVGRWSRPSRGRPSRGPGRGTPHAASVPVRAASSSIRPAEDAASSTSPRSSGGVDESDQQRKAQDRCRPASRPSAAAQAMHRGGRSAEGQVERSGRGDAVGVVLEPGEQGLRLRAVAPAAPAARRGRRPDAGSVVAARWRPAPSLLARAPARQRRGDRSRGRPRRSIRCRTRR